MRVVRPVLARCQRDPSALPVVRQRRTNWFTIRHTQILHQRDGWQAGDGGAVSIVVGDTPSVGVGTVDAGWFPL
jgi:hypothetical protein